VAHVDGDIQLIVRNSGSTISDRDRARLFERFYRGASAGHISGTGMGLAIVQQIARAHGGAVLVTSTPKEGTAFTLSFPRTDEAA
jgi:signal transduction histidine kinase